MNETLAPDTSVRLPLLARDGTVRAYTLVDAQDVARLSQWTWSLQGRAPGKQYAIRQCVIDGRNTHIALHREVVGLPRHSGPTTGDRLEPDHINGDGLDNRRENLRIVTHAQNQQNKRPNRNATSRYRGVYWRTNRRRWVAEVRHAGRHFELGYFTDEHEAARAASVWRAQHMTYAVEAA